MNRLRLFSRARLFESVGRIFTFQHFEESECAKIRIQLTLEGDRNPALHLRHNKDQRVTDLAETKGCAMPGA
jgi:hypothetical protein